MWFFASLYLLSVLQGPLKAEPFVVGDLMGQLGNQLFQIAATVSLAQDYGADPLFPALLEEKQFNIPLNYEKFFFHLNAAKPQKEIAFYYIEPHFHYAPIPYQPNMLIRGWFQSEKYFKAHRQEIMDLFAPSEEIMDYLKDKYGAILQHPQTVSIHFRSYRAEDPNHSVYAECDLDYFKKAISLFPQETLFVVFSNAIEWCKKNFHPLPQNFYFIEREPYYYDFYLMSRCKHNIISNSTFSWWAAYLNPNEEKKIYAPPRWFNPLYGADDKDLIPTEWIILK